MCETPIEVYAIRKVMNNNNNKTQDQVNRKQ